MKSISDDLKAHFGADCTTLAVLWKVTRQDGVKFGFTTHDQDITYPGPPIMQVGGILNIIDPVTLTLQRSYNITRAINASGVQTPVQMESQGSRGISSDPSSTIQWSKATNQVVVAYEYVGSPVYICNLDPASNTVTQVHQVALDPTVFDANGTPPPGFGTNGQDVFSVWLDKDGATVWAFEYFAAGFARINLSDGSVVHQNKIFGQDGYNESLAEREDGTVLFAQDNTGHYFLLTG